MNGNVLYYSLCEDTIRVDFLDKEYWGLKANYQFNLSWEQNVICH